MKRKTRDEFNIVTDYGYGWEVENVEDNLKDAKRSLKEYQENAKGLIGIRLVKKRVKIEGSEK